MYELKYYLYIPIYLLQMIEDKSMLRNLINISEYANAVHK